MYNAGLQPNLGLLYPPISFPVSRGTGAIAPLIEWDHSQPWTVAYYGGAGKQGAGESIVEIDLSLPEHEYISGHIIDGRVLFPATGYLVSYFI